MVSSLDGVTGGEKGIHIFGDADGKAIVQGGTAVELKSGSTTALHVDDGGLPAQAGVGRWGCGSARSHERERVEGAQVHSLTLVATLGGGPMSASV